MLFSTLDSAAEESPEVLRLTARAQLAQQQPLDAQSTLEKLLEETPDTAEIRHLLAQAAVAGGDLERGRRELRTALALDENYFPARLALARLDLSVTPKAFEEQLDWLDTNAADNPNVLQLRASKAATGPAARRCLGFGAPAPTPLSPNQKTLSGAQSNEFQQATWRVRWTSCGAGWTRIPNTAIRLAMGIAWHKRVIQPRRSTNTKQSSKRTRITSPPSTISAWETRESDPAAALGYAVARLTLPLATPPRSIRWRWLIL